MVLKQFKVPLSCPSNHEFLELLMWLEVKKKGKKCFYI